MATLARTTGSVRCTHRPNSERLATLDAATIDIALRDPRAMYPLISNAVDQYLDLDDQADAAFAAGDNDEAMYLHQEAAAWRATVTALKRLEIHGRTTECAPHADTPPMSAGPVSHDRPYPGADASRQIRLSARRLGTTTGHWPTAASGRPPWPENGCPTTG